MGTTLSPHQAQTTRWGRSGTHLLGAGEGDPRKGVPVHDQGDALAQLLLN